MVPTYQWDDPEERAQGAIFYATQLLDVLGGQAVERGVALDPGAEAEVRHGLDGPFWLHGHAARGGDEGLRAWHGERPGKFPFEPRGELAQDLGENLVHVGKAAELVLLGRGRDGGGVGRDTQRGAKRPPAGDWV